MCPSQFLIYSHSTSSKGEYILLLDRMPWSYLWLWHLWLSSLESHSLASPCLLTPSFKALMIPYCHNYSWIFFLSKPYTELSRSNHNWLFSIEDNLPGIDEWQIPESETRHVFLGMLVPKGNIKVIPTRSIRTETISCATGLSSRQITSTEPLGDAVAQDLQNN